MKETLEHILLAVSKSPIIDAGKLSQAARLILDSVLEGLAIRRAGIWLLDEDRQSIRCHLLIDQGNAVDSEALVLTRSDFPRYFAALDAERTIAAHDACRDPATAEFCQAYLKPLGITSMLDTPIRHRGQMVGIICAEHQGEIRQWSDDECVLAGALADLYGRAISAHQRASYEEQLQQALDNLKATQTQLIEYEKMAALGNLVAGVAHEVNTPLGIAITSGSHCQSEVRTLQQRYESGKLEERYFKEAIETLTEGLELQRRNLERAAQLVHDFKRTAADQTVMERERFNLADYLDASLSALRPMIRKQGIELTLELNCDLSIDSYPGALAQIMTNLITNACRHAFPDGATSPKRITIRCRSCDAQQVEISLADNGIGMDETTLQRAFEPFFTTARNKGGTGLGLSIIYNLATHKLKGSLTLESAPNQGSRFTLRIPQQLPADQS